MSAGRRTLAIVTALASVGVALTVAAVVRQSDGTPARVLSVDPGDGAALTSPPDAVTLRLSTGADSVLSHVTVRDNTGNAVNDGRVRADGKTGLRQPVRLTDPGDYSIAYHITFSNGQDATGILRFSVGTGAPPQGIVDVPDPILDDADHAHGIDPLGATLLVIDGLVLVVVLALLLRRPARHRRPPARASTVSAASGHLDGSPDEPAGR
ncbi:copper resistance CopC family protein [Verrucosispora sp. FIM060022]|uniref:copper resistance CopC family protein n=1 Tax=Verrucosispora sp. FIM060022 TaxID=1479020 RepID=UPI000F898FC7|nr:copper resistance CopC family protein [Verrucosispora sp. FIM060022]RUL92118.1 copper resistance protein CopC [Verrucosispora sp. FIM060022]